MTATAAPRAPEYVPATLGLAGAVETIGWAIILGHIVHWAVDALYYLFTQVSYMTVASAGAGRHAG